MGDEHDFLLPDLGEGLEEATILRWQVGVGDEVQLNQVLCTVETAKAEVEVPSPYPGVVTALGGADGDTLHVGTLLVRIRRPGIEAPPAPASRTPTLVGYGVDGSLDRSRRAGSVPSVAVAPAPAPASAAATDAWGRLPRAAAAVARRSDVPPHALAKPPVRKLARELGVDLLSLAPGGGPRGIITRAEVIAAARAIRTVNVPRATTSSRPADHDLVDVIPVRGVRARIADRMAATHATIPAAICSVTVDCETLLERRDELRSRRPEARSVTPFSMICACIVDTLVAHPTFNSSYVAESGEIHRYRAVHLGIGTATDRGLLVAVVRDAHTMDLLQLSEEIRRLAAAARDATIAPDELVGSTFTVSNFGGLGLDDGFPMINFPEAAIMGIGAVRRRPHVVGEELLVRHTANLTLAFDHRVGDGTEAAELLGSVRGLVESPPEQLLPQ